jgi:hypothetical protein
VRLLIAPESESRGRNGDKDLEKGARSGPPYDEIWEHKRGRIWLLVKRLVEENRALRYQVKVLQVRARRRDVDTVDSGQPE